MCDAFCEFRHEIDTDQSVLENPSVSTVTASYAVVNLSLLSCACPIPPHRYVGRYHDGYWHSGEVLSITATCEAAATCLEIAVIVCCRLSSESLHPRLCSGSQTEVVSPNVHEVSCLFPSPSGARRRGWSHSFVRTPLESR